MRNTASTKKDFIIIEVTQSEVAKLSFETINELLVSFNEKPEQYRDTVHLIFGGYDHVSSEIFEIKEIREWVGILIDMHPEILFYLEEEQCGLQNMLLCISENRVMKKIPNAVLSTPILDNKVLVETSIPVEKKRKILFNLAVNPLVLDNNSILTFTANRLKKFGIA